MGLVRVAKGVRVGDMGALGRVGFRRVIVDSRALRVFRSYRRFVSAFLVFLLVSYL